MQNMNNTNTCDEQKTTPHIDIFYHASNISGLVELLPLSKMYGGEQKVCYFTPNREYALFYLRDMEINHVTCGIDANGIPVYHEQFPKQLVKIYGNRVGYLYSSASSDLINKGHTGGVWVATTPVRVDKVEYIADVYTEILKAEKKGAVRIIRYEGLSEEKKSEINEMMKTSILKNNRLHESTSKSLFYKENFPAAWQAAKDEEEKLKVNMKTDEELHSRIYPIILSEYNPDWPLWFSDEKANLERLIGKDAIVRINHIGSTAVPGLLAKPTVDILLEIEEDTDIDALISALPSSEYICLRQEGNSLSRHDLMMIIKGYLSDGFAEKVYHIHVRYPRDLQNHAVIYDELYFRNYLISCPKVAKEYTQLKCQLFRVYEHDRDGYTSAKGAFIKEITVKAKMIKHYDTLIDENNDPVHDPAPLQEHMDKWDGKAFIDALQLAPDKSVLEIGVGTGRLAIHVCDKCESFTGIDISQKSIERAKENLKDFQNICLICGDYLTYPFEKTYDVIYSSLTFMHIKDKHAAIKKIAELLSPQGLFILSINKNTQTSIDFGDRKIEVYPDSTDETAALIAKAELTMEKQFETEFAVVFVARKGKFVYETHSDTPKY